MTMTKMMAALLVALLAVPAAIAVDYTVGDSDGWESGVNYEDWVKGKTFNVGDTLVFTYGASHTVDVVTKDGYDNCDGSKASSRFSDGNSTIELKTAGPHYYICPTFGHCGAGMKLSVTVKAGTPTPTPTTPTPSTPSTPPSTGGSKTPPPSTNGSATPPTANATPDAGSMPSPPPPSGNAGAGSMGFLTPVLITLSVILGYAVC